MRENENEVVSYIRMIAPSKVKCRNVGVGVKECGLHHHEYRMFPYLVKECRNVSVGVGVKECGLYHQDETIEMTSKMTDRGWS